MEEQSLDKNVDGEEVKSNAIVKYSVQKPAQFMKLECNTDLNLPPSNWLSSSVDSYGLQHVVYQQKGFSSFQMAHMFPDCVGEVDIVSDAENIKNLLKIPYHKGHISMMVHRIENTLLLDDFDIYKHLLKTAETEWDWLKTFFMEQINSETCEEDKNTYAKQRKREALKQRSLVSKFLYHSLVDSEAQDCVEAINNKTHPFPFKEPLLPEPAEVPNSATFDQKFNRNVVWTFENIEMLLGTDLPIFGGGTHPCISLRLRDMSKPINVLTGIDYWLDNLMSNVPEVVMCYHLNGIVQKYELIKTDDLPRLDNSKFSPQLIRDVAQSILSFLKSNVTKAGHTYWLFKGKDEEVIKLYDLTSLCSESDVDNGQNPFTIPVAMLLYRVARNMKHSSDQRQPGTIRMLLKNCIKLLPAEKYPEIVTSSHYMLSDLYVPVNTNPESPNLDQPETDDVAEYDDDLNDIDLKDEAARVLVLNSSNICEKFTNYKIPPPINGGVEDRCWQAIQHISAGLSCLKYFPNAEKDPRKEDEIQMAKPFEPIPMPYSKLSDTEKPHEKKLRKKDKKKRPEKNTNDSALLLKANNEAQALPTWQNLSGNEISWNDHLKTLLYEKAVLTFAILVEHYFMNGQYGASLRNVGLLARCELLLTRLYKPSAVRKNYLLGRAGDCAIMIIQNWTKVEDFREQLVSHVDEEYRMMEQLEKDEQSAHINIGKSVFKCVFLYDLRTIEQMLMKAIACYEEALTVHYSDSILKRLGNSLNEVASFYLHKAKNSKTEEEIIESCKKGEPFLIRGLEVFEKVKDEANVALLYSNMGHLHRLLAYAHTPKDRGELTTREKFHYNKSFINYKKAIQVLGERKHCPGIWDAVKWELSTALFNMGCIMHDYPSANLSRIEAEKEVIETLQTALKYCDLDEENTKFPSYQYRAALIHYRIGSLYHYHVYKMQNDTVNRKNIIQLARINYEKASSLFFTSADTINYLTAQMQRVALSEYLAESTPVLNTKIKNFQHCLQIVIEINSLIELLVTKKIEVSEEDAAESEDSFKSSYSLLCLVKTRLQHILKVLVKICLTKPPPNKHCDKLVNLYKSCYKITFVLKDNMPFSELVDKLHSVLTTISAEVEEYNNAL